MKRISILVCTIALCLPLLAAGCDNGKEERAKLKEVEKELADLKDTSQSTSSERDTLKTELAAVTKARDELRARVTTLVGEEEALQSQISTLTTSSQRLDGEVTKLTESIEKLTGQLRMITVARDKMQKDFTELRTTRDGLQAQVAELTTQRDEAIGKEQKAQEELAVLTAKALAAGVKSGTPNDGLVAIAEASPEKGTPKVEGAKLPTVHSFDSFPTQVDKGQSTTLTWSVSNASEIRIEPGGDSVSTLGSKNVRPTKTTTYTLTAKNDNGQTVETCKVEVR